MLMALQPAREMSSRKFLLCKTGNACYKSRHFLWKAAW